MAVLKKANWVFMRVYPGRIGQESSNVCRINCNVNSSFSAYERLKKWFK